MAPQPAARDAHLRALSRTTQWVAIGSAVGVVGMAAALAQAFPGHTAAAVSPSASPTATAATLPQSADDGATTLQPPALVPTPAPTTAPASAPAVSGGS